MNRSLRLILGFGAAMLLSTAVTAADPPTVTEVSVPSLNWGEQQARVGVNNATPYVRYIAAETEVRFTGAGLNPTRRARTFGVAYPNETTILNPTIVIPGNYGEITAEIRLYDVVDTLDQLLPSQLFFDTTLQLTFDAPPQVKPYLEEQITMPPRVNVNPDFDNDFARLVLLLISEGKSVPDIREITGGDSAYVAGVIEHFRQRRYLKDGDHGIELDFPVISEKEAFAEKAIADKVVDSLVGIYTTNLPKMIAFRDSLAAAGAISSDTIDFLNGAVPLYKPYPLIGMFSLWSHLGRAFITRMALLHIFDATDVCNAHIPYYMYAVQGPDSLNGHHFYAIVPQSYPQYFWGDRIPSLNCDPDYIRKGLMGQHVSWSFQDDEAPQIYVYDTAAINPALAVLQGQTDSLIWHTYNELLDSAVAYGHSKASYGHRYWFWNLVATRTLQRLVEDGVVERLGTGQFRFDRASAF